MGIFSLFKKKRGGYRGYEFSDEDRELSSQKRLLKQKTMEMENELQKKHFELKMAQIDEKLAELRGPEQDNSFDPNTLLMTILAGKMQPQTPIVTATAPQAVTLSDDAIRETINGFPRAHLKIFSKMPVEIQQSKIRQFFPEVDDDSIQRALKILHE